jgi:hypothetical protein
VAAFVGILVLILMIMDFNSRLESLNALKKQAGIVSTQATQAMQTQMALQTQVAYAQSDQVVHEWARNEGHYIQSGDQPVVPVEVPGLVPEALSTPTFQLRCPTGRSVNLFFEVQRQYICVPGGRASEPCF